MSVAWEWVEGGCCSECGHMFDGMHLASRVTCSPRCRKRRERRLRDPGRWYREIMSSLGIIRQEIKGGDFVPEHVAELRQISQEVRDLLMLAKDPDEISRRDMLYDRNR